MSDTEIVLKIAFIVYIIIGIFVASRTPEPRFVTELEALSRLFFAAYLWPIQLIINRYNSRRNK